MSNPLIEPKEMRVGQPNHYCEEDMIGITGGAGAYPFTTSDSRPRMG